MFKYLFMVIYLFNNFAPISAKEMNTENNFEILQNDNSYDFTPTSDLDSDEIYIEFDDFPSNELPDFDSSEFDSTDSDQTESLYGGISEAVFAKKSHDYSPSSATEDAIYDQNEFGIDIHGHPSAIVNGCINVISGEFVETAIDFALPGVKPLTMRRNYFGGKCLKNSLHYGWQINHGAKLFTSSSKHNHLIAFIKGSERHGLLFKDALSNGRLICPSSFFYKGVTNCSLGEISAKTNFKNDSLLHLVKDRFELHTSDRGCFNFIKSSFDPERTHGQHLHGYRLTNRKLSDGSTYFYEYSNTYGMPRTIRYLNRDGLDIAGLELKHSPDKKHFKKNPNLTYLTSTGEELTYHFTLYGDRRHKGQIRKRNTKRAILSKVVPPHAPTIEYTYESFHDKTKRQRIYKRELPDQRVLKLTYCDDENSKVYRIFSPSGKNNAMLATYTFWRDDKSGECQVENALGGLKNYHWDTKSKRLYNIVTCDENDNTICNELFRWGDDYNDKSHLTARILVNGDGHLFAYQRYRYNVDGNIDSFSLYGNITGGEHNQRLSLDPYIKSPSGKHCDVYKLKYSYDAQKRRITKDDGRTIERYSYVGETELVSAKFICYGGRIQIRHFYEYDASGAVCSEIIDNGSSEKQRDLSDASRRAIKKIKNSPTGLPEQITEHSVNCSSGNKQFIREIVNQYDRHGWLIAQSLYDSKKELAYTLEWNHDSHGNIIYAKDALGNVTVSQYDANDNLVFEHKPDSAPRVLAYDFMNRLISENQEGLNENLCKLYTYDTLGNCTSSTDIYGNETLNEYDSNGRLIKTLYPESYWGKRKTEQFVRNAQGFVTALTDGNGYTTLMEYTINGKLISKTYPDGITERNIYTLWGELGESINRDGTRICFSYDPLGREIKKEWLDNAGNSLKTTSKAYNAFDLLSEKDGNGITTKYTYDDAGRVISKKIKKKQTEFSYDTLGRKTKTTKLLGKDKTLSYVEVFDKLNRVIEFYKITPDGEIIDRIVKRFDAQGNEVESQEFNQAGKAVTKIQYDLLGRQISVRNPLQETTRTAYLRSGNNLQIETTDPRGVKTLTTYNSFGIPIVEQRFDPMGCLVQQTEYNYDLNGNKIARYVTTSNAKLVETRWQYNSLNQLVSTIEASGTSDQKTTQRSYDRAGRLETLIKNDGNKLFWTYDALGLKKSTKSSDGSLYYSYNYDLNDNLLEAKDEINNTSIARAYDHYNQLISEKLPYGHKLNYSYDLLGNVKDISLPDSTKISYTHNGDRLHSITRKGALSYQQVYAEYDKSSNPTRVEMPKAAGTLEIDYDLLNRVIDTRTGNWKEELKYSDHLLTQRTLNDNIGRNVSKYSYDARDQLLSEDGTAEHTFEYDMSGNPVLYDGHSRTFSACNALLNQEGQSYGYDTNGNRTSDGENTYRYDALDRLIEAKTFKGTFSYVYDPLGRRVALLNESEKDTTYFLWQKQREIGAISKDGSIKELQILDPRNRAVAFELKGELYIPIHDVLGHVRALLDKSGLCVATYRYSAFGEEQIAGEVLSPWRYSGKRHDVETGLVYFGVRYYDSKTQCWLTPDPLGDIDGPNLYTYVLNNPQAYIDPDGRFVFIVAIPIMFEVFTISWGACGAIAASFITYEAIVSTVVVAATAAVLMNGSQKLEQVANGEGKAKSEEDKKKNRDPKYPGSDSDLEKNPEWSDTTHPKPREEGKHREFTNVKTGERVRFDKGDPKEPGHRGEDHYHRYNPNSRMGKRDRYLDANGNSAAYGSDASHLYGP